MDLATFDQTVTFGQKLGGVLRPGDLIALTGPLGSGKTSLTRGILAGNGFEGDVPSPSFPIVIPYFPPDVRIPIWHVDLYRIDTVADLIDLGLQDALRDGALIVEWPQLLSKDMLQHGLQLALEIRTNDVRHLTAIVPPSWRERWPLQ
jgi:tRNA threonylcarbamoyladenosine biosynthesis protein TsaE